VALGRAGCSQGKRFGPPLGWRALEMETAHVGRKEKKKKRRKKGVGRGMEKKLGRQGFGPRGLSFKQSIFYFLFNSKFESNSVLIQIQTSSTRTLNYSTQSVQKKMQAA
jgi:hypothetical protein